MSQLLSKIVLDPETIAFVFGLIVTLLIGLGTIHVLNSADTAPPKALKSLWLKKGVGADTLGLLERLLFFGSAWAGAYLLIGAWLAFKVASKWYSWQHIVQVPDNDDTTKHSLSLEDRHKLGSRIVTRFLIGTLYNLLAGLAGAMAGARLQQILTRGFLL